MQTRWAMSGASGSNAAYPLVKEYFYRKMLSGLGITGGLEELDDLRAEAFMIISSEVAKIEHERMRRAQAKRR